MRGRLAGVVLAAVLAAGPIGLAGCGGSSGGSSGGGTGDGTITLVPEDKRQQAVDLRGTTLEGVPLDVGSFRGKVVVINVWGSWCSPCRKEAPDLQAAYTQLKPKGVEFVGIDVNDKDEAQARAFQKAFGVTYPSLADDGGASLLALRGAVPPNAVPTTVVLDRQGRVAARISSATTKATVVGVVEDILSGKAGP